MYREDKATAMACFFLEHEASHELNDIKLMKLLYIAERKSLEMYSMPIAGDDYVSMEHGPVLSTTYRLMSSEKVGEVWNKHIAAIRRWVSGHEQEVPLIEAVAYESILRGCEISILEEVWREFGSWSKWQLKDYCHKNFKEYDERAEKMKTSIKLDLETIFTALGDEPELAKEKSQEVLEFTSA
jgi:uncharacterized phage-associated protein